MRDHAADRLAGAGGRTAEHDGPAERRTARWVVVVAALVLVVSATLLVPWDPVPGGDLALPDPSEHFTAAEVERAEDHARWSRTWGWSGLAVSLLAAAALGLTRRGRRLVARLPGPWWLRVLLGVAVFDVVVRIVTLPFSVVQRRLQRANGLTRQSWGDWAVDVVKGELVDVVVTGLVLVLLVGLARRWRRAWPAVAAGLVAALVVLGSFAYPVLVEPVFNSFTSLPDGELRTAVLALAEEEGVPVDDVLVADASRRTTTLNAYVSGFGGTRRVVLYDNLVDDVPRDEALSVVAHELAHARHGDVVIGTALGAAGAGLGVGLLALLLPLGGRSRRGEDGPTMGEPAVVPLVLALVAVGSLLALPVQNGISRQIETRADVDALAATGEREPFVQLQRRLALRSLADPTPPGWSQWWFGSHPTVLTRIALADRVAGSPQPRG